MTRILLLGHYPEQKGLQGLVGMRPRGSYGHSQVQDSKGVDHWGVWRHGWAVGARDFPGGPVAKTVLPTEEPTCLN